MGGVWRKCDGRSRFSTLTDKRSNSSGVRVSKKRWLFFAFKFQLCTPSLPRTHTHKRGVVGVLRSTAEGWICTARPRGSVIQLGVRESTGRSAPVPSSPAFLPSPPPSASRRRLPSFLPSFPWWEKAAADPPPDVLVRLRAELLRLYAASAPVPAPPAPVPAPSQGTSKTWHARRWKYPSQTSGSGSGWGGGWVEGGGEVAISRWG